MLKSKRVKALLIASVLMFAVAVPMAAMAIENFEVGCEVVAPMAAKGKPALPF